jgi:hypothetical protein
MIAELDFPDWCCILFLLSVPAMAQSDRFYTTSGGEWIFSFADLSINDEQQGSSFEEQQGSGGHPYLIYIPMSIAIFLTISGFIRAWVLEMLGLLRIYRAQME